MYKCALLQCEKKYSIGNLKKDTRYQSDSVFYDWLTYDPSTENGCKNCVSLPVCAGGCGGSGTFRYGTHHHSNCFESSPKMLKMAIRQYINLHYMEIVKNFLSGPETVKVLESAIYQEP